MNYATLVFSAPTDEALEALVRPLFAQPGFSADEAKPRIVAASWSQDAMSVLDAVVLLVDSRLLDSFELVDCIKEIAEARTWEACLAKFAEWEFEVLDGELVDLREEQAA